MSVFYMYCACVKFDMLASALVTIPDDAKHNGSFKTIVYSPGHRNGASMSRTAKCDSTIADALNKQLRIIVSKDNETMNRIKRQKVESELFAKLHDEYLTLHGKIHDFTVPPFLQTMNKARLVRIENQITALTRASVDLTGVDAAIPPPSQSANQSLISSVNTDDNDYGELGEGDIGHMTSIDR